MLSSTAKKLFKLILVNILFLHASSICHKCDVVLYTSTMCCYQIKVSVDLRH